MQRRDFISSVAAAIITPAVQVEKISYPDKFPGDYIFRKKSSYFFFPSREELIAKAQATIKKSNSFIYSSEQLLKRIDKLFISWEIPAKYIFTSDEQEIDTYYRRIYYYTDPYHEMVRTESIYPISFGLLGRNLLGDFLKPGQMIDRAGNISDIRVVYEEHVDSI